MRREARDTAGRRPENPIDSSNNGPLPATPATTRTRSKSMPTPRTSHHWLDVNSLHSTHCLARDPTHHHRQQLYQQQRSRHGKSVHVNINNKNNDHNGTSLPTTATATANQGGVAQRWSKSLLQMMGSVVKLSNQKQWEEKSHHVESKHVERKMAAKKKEERQTMRGQQRAEAERQQEGRE